MNARKAKAAREVARELYSLKEVANACGVHEDTVYRWTRKGEVKYTRVGPKLIRIPLEEMQRLVECRRPV